jgi:hypothetical protein
MFGWVGYLITVVLEQAERIIQPLFLGAQVERAPEAACRAFSAYDA